MRQDGNNYSTIQYLLWLIAGSEISVLKKCPNDYNRHANIGLMILITSLFASLTAYVAGNTFEKENTTGVVIFAIIWGFLIFSLDRSMVNSIKKDPTQSEKSIWGYFAPRLILAIILSFFMSIPLDHIVFEDNIERQLNQNNLNSLKSNHQKLVEVFNPKQDSLDAERARNMADNLQNQLNKPCPRNDYKLLLNEIEICNNEVKKLTNDRNVISARIRKIKSEFEENQNIELPSDLLENERRVTRKLNVKNTELKLKKSRRDLIYTEWYNLLSKQKADFEGKVKISDSIRSEKARVIDSNTTVTKVLLDRTTGFDVKFTTLFLIPNFGVQFLKWLIFLALFVIEILPTFLKLKTPIGQYDWEIYKSDKETEIQALARIDKFNSEANEIEKYRKDEEVKMNKNLINQVVSIEERIANEMLEEWEIKAREQMKINVDRS
jgi:hypothetical protein